MNKISYSEGEKRLIYLNKIANLNEVVYLNALSFLVSASGSAIPNVDFSIYILFTNDIQLDFDHNDMGRYCKFELREVDSKCQITAFYYEKRNVYPVIEDIKLEDIFKSVENFFK